MIIGRLWGTVAAVGVGAALVTGIYWYGHQRGAESERLGALRRSVEILRERSVTDAEIRNMDDRRLCVELGGMPDDCSKL